MNPSICLHVLFLFIMFMCSKWLVGWQHWSMWVSEQFLNGTSAHNRPFQCHHWSMHAVYVLDENRCNYLMGPMELVHFSFVRPSVIDSLQPFVTGCHFFTGLCGELIGASPHLLAGFKGEKKRSRKSNGWNGDRAIMSETGERMEKEKEWDMYSPHLSFPTTFQQWLHLYRRAVWACHYWLWNQIRIFKFSTHRQRLCGKIHEKVVVCNAVQE